MTSDNGLMITAEADCNLVFWHVHESSDKNQNLGTAERST